MTGFFPGSSSFTKYIPAATKSPRRFRPSQRTSIGPGLITPSYTLNTSSHSKLYTTTRAGPDCVGFTRMVSASPLDGKNGNLPDVLPIHT